MSKGLEALEKGFWKLTHKGNIKFYNIVEEELIRLEQQDSVIKILKEVIGFAQMLPLVEPNKDNGLDIMPAVRINIQRTIENRERELLRKWVLETCFPKELKAFEIIINKRVDVLLFAVCRNINEYNNLRIYEEDKLTEKEYKILCEITNNKKIPLYNI